MTVGDSPASTLSRLFLSAKYLTASELWPPVIKMKTVYRLVSPYLPAAVCLSE